MVDERAEGVVADEIGDNIPNSFVGIRRPYRGKVVMLHHPGTFNV